MKADGNMLMDETERGSQSPNVSMRGISGEVAASYPGRMPVKSRCRVSGCPSHPIHMDRPKRTRFLHSEVEER